MEPSLTATNGKFKDDIEKRYTIEQFHYKQGYGDKILIKQKEEFDKYLNTYMTTSAKHNRLVKDNYQRKMSFIFIKKI